MEKISNFTKTRYLGIIIMHVHGYINFGSVQGPVPVAMTTETVKHSSESSAVNKDIVYGDGKGIMDCLCV